MVASLLNAFILGLVGGLIPGPVLTATFTEILQAGFGKSLRIIFWAMLTETIVAFISLVALSSVGISDAVFKGLSLIGAAILIWIAASIWNVKTLDTEQRVHFSLGKISAMILANGVLWTFWITVCVPKAILLSKDLPLGELIFLLLVEIGWLLSTVAVAWAFSGCRNILSNPKFIPLLFKFFALVFVYFAGSMLYDSVVFFAAR